MIQRHCLSRVLLMQAVLFEVAGTLGRRSFKSYAGFLVVYLFSYYAAPDYDHSIAVSDRRKKVKVLAEKRF